jgi:hypothetical protein
MTLLSMPMGAGLRRWRQSRQPKVGWRGTSGQARAGVCSRGTEEERDTWVVIG